jgi:Tfp pilus assembly PilM family ATPase
VLSWGGSDLDVALARTLDLTPAAAEPLKHGLALGEGGEAAGLDAPEADAARAAMLNELRSFARELVGSLRYYQEQPNSLGIAEILITGGASAAPGLAAELERLIGIPVHVAEPMARVRVPRKLRNQNGSAGSLAVAVGLGIED